MAALFGLELPEAVLKRTRLVWINSPHNPSGAVLTRDELRRTWEVCRAHDILLASDECYVDVYDREPPPRAELGPWEEHRD